MKVINLENEKLKRSPHVSGKVTCMHCKHEWVAIAQHGNDDLQCPECNLYRGVWAFNFIPDQETLQCGMCGGFYYSVVKTGIVCVGCGSKKHFEDVWVAK